MSLWKSCLLLILANPAFATRECGGCIPLDLLASPAYGISLSNHGIESAVKFHNGTIRSCGSVEAPDLYLALLRRFERESNGSSLDDPWRLWRDWNEQIKHPSVGIFESITNWIQKILDNASAPSPSSALLPPLTPEARIFRAVFTRLQKSTQENQGCGQMKYVGLSIPPYLTDAHFNHLVTAAAHSNLIVKDIGHSPAAASAAEGIELCRVPSEYLPCERLKIASLDLSNDGLTAVIYSITPTHYLLQHRSYIISHSVSANSSQEQIKSWLLEFATIAPKLSRLYLVGPLANSSLLQEAIRKSPLGPILRESRSHAEALGMAAMAKETMEEQDSDCIEPPECEEVRREADRIAGKTGVVLDDLKSEL